MSHKKGLAPFYEIYMAKRSNMSILSCEMEVQAQ